MLDDTIINRPDAIVFIPVDSQAMVAGIERVNAANIPVINITDPVLGGELVSFMGCDEVSLGAITGAVSSGENEWSWQRHHSRGCGWLTEQ